MDGEHDRVAKNDEAALDQPTLPLGPRKKKIETLGMFQVPNQQRTRERQERARHDRCDPQPGRTVQVDDAKQHEQRRHQVNPAGDAFPAPVASNDHATVSDVEHFLWCVGTACPCRPGVL